MTEFATVGKAADVPEGGLAAFDLGPERVAVAKVDGSYYAFDDTCTHRQCSLSDGDLEETSVICPCHAGTFDVRTGKVLAGPPPAPVRTYEVRVDGDHLQVSPGPSELAESA